MNDKPLKEADWQKAVAETNRLQRELDITNADHIALWIEANTIPDEPMSQCASWLACRIIEAHEIEMAKARLALQSRIEALEAALRNMVDEYVCNVDSYRTGGFYSDPRKDDCVINAEAALESQP